MKMVKTKLIIFFGLILLFSCKENKGLNDDLNELEPKKAKIFDEREVIVQTILDLPSFQSFYHVELKERIPIKLLESKMIDRALELRKFDRAVIIMSLTELESNGISDYIEFQKLDIQSDTTYFSFFYNIEGAGANGKLAKINGEWKIADYFLYEK